MANVISHSRPKQQAVIVLKMRNDMIDSENPFASPLAGDRTADVAETDAEQIRRKYLSHEASIKSMGFLYLLGAVLTGLGTVAFVAFTLPALFTGQMGQMGTAELSVMFGIGLLYAVLTAVQGWVGWGLRYLNPKVRVAGILLSVIGLLGFPIGTLISAYFLYLLASKKGKYVLSDEYRAIVAETPHIKYRTSIVVWILLGLLVAVIVFAIVGVLISSVS